MLGKKMNSIITFTAASPIHAGSGFSTSSVDLPIQRERHTSWPHIQASAVKGAMRDHFRNNGNQKDEINFIFGTDNSNDNVKGKSDKMDDMPSAFSVSDAKLLFFPMRSNIYPFVLVTCPAVLKRLNMDLEFIGEDTFNLDGLQIGEYDAVVLKGDNSQSEIVLEDIMVNVSQQKMEIDNDFIGDTKYIMIISDSAFNYCVTKCTEVQTNITIDSEKGTAKDGALRYQELLPADSVLYSVVCFSNTIENKIQANSVKTHIKNSLKGFIQVGGDETLGRGVCKVEWKGDSDE